MRAMEPLYDIRSRRHTLIASLADGCLSPIAYLGLDGSGWRAGGARRTTADLNAGGLSSILDTATRPIAGRYQPMAMAGLHEDRRLDREDQIRLTRPCLPTLFSLAPLPILLYTRSFSSCRF